MKPIGIVAGLLVAMVLSGLAHSAHAAKLAPFQYVLALQKLQDQIVVGKGQAFDAQQKLLQLMASEFSQSKYVSWQNRKNAEALLIFLLSGGNPQIIVKLLAVKNAPNLPENVLAGALAFVVGRKKQAQKLLENVKLNELGINAGAQLALVKASILARDKPREALKSLAFVRLLKPGTLLEEAALRRSVAIAGQIQEVDLFLRYSSIYARRFPKSHYISEFISRFSYFVVALASDTHGHFMEKVNEIVERLKTREKAVIYLTVSRAAMLEGKLHLAEYFGNKSLEYFHDSPTFVARAKTYLGAALVVTSKQSEGISLLESVDRTQLSPKDQKILDSSLLLVAQMQNTTSLDENNTTKSAKTSERKLRESDNQHDKDLMRKAEKLLAQTSQLLESAKDGFE